MDGCWREAHKGCLGKGTAQKEQIYALFQVFVTCDPAGERLLNPFFLPRHGTSFRQILVWSATCLFRIQTPRVVGWALLRAVDAAQADAFRVLVVQDFEGVAVEDGNDGVGEVLCEYG